MFAKRGTGKKKWRFDSLSRRTFKECSSRLIRMEIARLKTERGKTELKYKKGSAQHIR